MPALRRSATCEEVGLGVAAESALDHHTNRAAETAAAKLHAATSGV